VSNFIPIEAEGDRFYIEVLPADGQTGIKQRSRDGITEKLTKDDFKHMIRQAVMPACQTFVDVWQELNQPLTAESAEVEFNLGFTASGSAVIVQASGQASFKVKVSWKFQQPNHLAMENFNTSDTTREFSLLQNKILEALSSLEKATKGDYEAVGGILLVPKLTKQIIIDLQARFGGRENVIVWNEETFIPEQNFLNLKQATKDTLQTLQLAVRDGGGGGGVLFLFKPSSEDTDWLTELKDRWVNPVMELGGHHGYVISRPAS